MTTVLDSIPEPLARDVQAALAWFNARGAGEFEVTGIVDPPAAPGAERDLRLVLCGEGTCRQETFRVDGAQVEWLGDGAASEAAGVAELDPPPGPRRAWLDDVALRHPFSVVLFYRGFW